MADPLPLHVLSVEPPLDWNIMGRRLVIEVDAGNRACRLCPHYEHWEEYVHRSSFCLLFERHLVIPNSVTGPLRCQECLSAEIKPVRIGRPLYISADEL